jgi:O-antigen/teichoic acid export membrane protein
MAYYGLLAPAGEMGTVNLLVREIARQRDLTNRYVVHATVLTATACAVAIGVFVFVTQHIRLNHDLTLGASIMALALLPGTLNSIQEAVFIAHQRVYLQTVAGMVTAIANVAGGVYLIESGHGVISLLVLFVALEYAVTALYFGIIGRRIAPLSWEWDWSFVRSFVREVRPFAGTSLVAALFSRPEIIILSLVTGTAQVGYYSAALKVASLWNDVTQVFMANVFPVLSRLHAEGRAAFDELRARVLQLLLAGSLPLAVGAIVVAEPLTKTLFGANFGPAVTPMRILALTLPLVSIQAVLWRILSVRSQQGIVFRVQLISVGARVAASYPLVVLTGATGASIGVTIAFVLHTALLGGYVHRDGTRLELIRLSWPFAAASAAMGGMTWVVLRHVDLWAAIPTAVAIYGLLLLPTAVRPNAMSHGWRSVSGRGYASGK